MYSSIRFNWMLRNSFQYQSVMESTFLKAISLKRPTSLNIVNNKVNGSDKGILIQVKTNLERSYQLHSTSLIWMFDCHQVLRLCILFPRTCNLVEILVSDRIILWLTKFLHVTDKVSLHQDVNNQFVSCDLQFHSSFSSELIGIIIWVVNNLLSFIFTTSFGDEYNFLNFHCEDPFIVLLNVSWRPKWFSKIFWFLECWSDTRAWRGFMLFFIKYWSPESMLVIIWVSPISIILCRSMKR